jgi:Sulfate permease family
MSVARQQRPRLLFSSFEGWTKDCIGQDILAGLTLTAITVPEQMATAKLGGFEPQIGFYAFIGATIGFVVLGASRVLTAGADSTITPIFAGTLAALAASGSVAVGSVAITLALLVGVMLIGRPFHFQDLTTLGVVVPAAEGAGSADRSAVSPAKHRMRCRASAGRSQRWLSVLAAPRAGARRRARWRSRWRSCEHRHAPTTDSPAMYRLAIGPGTMLFLPILRIVTRPAFRSA